MSKTSAAVSARLLSFLERIERLEARESAIAREIRDIEAEAGIASIWTYFIRAGVSGPIKIGVATNVDHRLASLQTGHYQKLTVIRLIRGNAERALHRKFAHLRIRGEWFHFDEAMLAADIVDDASLKFTSAQHKRLLLVAGKSQ
jgi:hypothetical protein